jgi:hypothetical protein
MTRPLYATNLLHIAAYYTWAAISRNYIHMKYPCRKKLKNPEYPSRFAHILFKSLFTNFIPVFK